MSYKKLFRRFLDADPDRLHFAAHSHHPWPDVTYQSHVQAWEDAVHLMDDKWDTIFGRVVPETRIRIATLLGLPDPGTIAFAPNTHELVMRVFSCLTPPVRPNQMVRIVTTDAEFHAFDRQSRRWEEAGAAEVTRVEAEPFETFADRMRAAVSGAGMVYLSQVFFDSGFRLTDLQSIVAAAPDDCLVVVDGYHAFMALPIDLSDLSDRVFYVAGGYKYAMAGEGACFMHCPPGYGARPVDTGWLAGFGDLTERKANNSGAGAVTYGEDGDRFWGATFDPSGLYRLLAVLRMIEVEGITPGAIHHGAGELQSQFLESAVLPGQLTPAAGVARGNFLTFRTERAAEIYNRLHDQKVIVDYRGDRLRIGFGIYHDPEDVDRLAGYLSAL